MIVSGGGKAPEGSGRVAKTSAVSSEGSEGMAEVVAAPSEASEKVTETRLQTSEVSGAAAKVLVIPSEPSSPFRLCVSLKKFMRRIYRKMLKLDRNAY